MTVSVERRIVKLKRSTRSVENGSLKIREREQEKTWWLWDV